MIVENNKKSIEASGLVESGQFSIKTTAAAFQMLSSGLYSNKIRAVVRELSSNAVDAHVSIGNQATPIEVKLPNNLDSQFYVKDFGPGLSHEHLMKMYTTYFDSTKQASNDFIGGFGVGSKSPFAYTDSFTVESRNGGKKRVYSAYIGEDNTPQIAMLNEMDMEPSETTGLTVSMPVRPNDFSNFEKEAADLFKWFTTTPQILGTSRTIEKPELTKVNDTIYWRKHADYGQNIVVRMGQVVYPIDKYLGNLQDADLIQKVSRIQKFKPLIEVPIGKMSVAASREEVAYDKPTKEYVETKITELYDIAMEDVITRLQAVDLKSYHGLKSGMEFLKEHYLQNFVSDEQAKKMVEQRQTLPELNRILMERGVSIDPYLPIIRGLDQPTNDELKLISVTTPYTKEKVENWFSKHSYTNRFSCERSKDVVVLEVDLPLTSVYAERARKQYMLKNPSHMTTTIALYKKEEASDADYQKVKNDLLQRWGLTDKSVKELSNCLLPDDYARYKKTQATATVPATTFFSGRPSMCSSDLKSFYYAEVGNNGYYAVPEGWEASKYFKLIETLKENASLSKEFLKVCGADAAALSRCYTIQSTDMDKVKTFKGAKSLNTVLEGALANPDFKTCWDKISVSRNREPITGDVLFEKSGYGFSRQDKYKDLLPRLEKTQLGQAVLWFKSMNAWQFDDQGRRPDDIQFIMLGGLLNEAHKGSAPLPAKLLDQAHMNKAIETYYPLLQNSNRNISYNTGIDYIEELTSYLEWRDTRMPVPLIDGVTTLPNAVQATQSLNTTSQLSI